MGNQHRQKTPYLGSVRFFKHLILTVLALLILIPTVLFLAGKAENRRLRAELSDLHSAPALQRSDPDDQGEDAPPPAYIENLLEVPGEETDDGPAYRRLYPDLYQPVGGRTPVNEPKTVYLTFDDGPSVCTDEILDILQEYGVKATFFVVGKSDEESVRRMRRIVDEGHTLGIHSYSHEYSDIYSSVEDYLADIHAVYCLVRENVGIDPKIIRFPGGSINGYNAVIWKDLVVEMVRRGFVYFDWNVSSDDAVSGSPASVDSIVSRCLGNAHNLNRAVILMHDSASKRTTVSALPRVIEGYQAAGFTFAALSENVKPVVFNYPK